MQVHTEIKIRLMHIFAMSSAELKKLMEELSELCRSHGRQKEIAQEMGVSEQVLSNWLNGSRSPSLDSYFKIQEFLKKQKRRRGSTR
jgi:transcriptional regulator with XRE-family HTH domain